MAVPSRLDQCSYSSCRKPLTQTSKTGRRRRYCDASCRRRAQTARDRARRTGTRTRPTGHSSAIAADVHTLAQELVEGQRRRIPLEMKLKLAQLLNRDITCYVAAAVQDEWAAGETWSAIASAAGTTEASARACWSEVNVAGLLAARPARHRRRAQPQSTPHPLDWAFTRPTGPLQRAAARVLQEYLSSLRRTAPVSTGEVARLAGLPDDAVTLSLGGELIASWPVTHMLVTILSGQPQILRTAWETASGERQPDTQSESEARRCLGDVLQVLHLAAGEPEPGALAEEALLSLTTVRAALAGSLVPDWPATRRLTVALGAEPSIMQPFWDDWACAGRSRDESNGGVS
ncbi:MULTISPECIES: hypothetical protein [Streptomyces]|uniref:Uncharacterized protein n=1 Tax=Streptomyces anulatus TaxID=1892 RepID=A0ABZ1ZFT6_STRAQ|nr:MULTISPECIES: hypothetical protein [Streptomyces]